MYKYETIIYWSEEDECFIAEVPDLSELMVHGGSQEEALKNAQTAIRFWLKTAEREGINIPEPKGRRLNVWGQVRVVIVVAKAMKIMMWRKKSSQKTRLADDIREAVAELKLVRQGKLETRDARDLIDEI